MLVVRDQEEVLQSVEVSGAPPVSPGHTCPVGGRNLMGKLEYCNINGVKSSSQRVQGREKEREFHHENFTDSGKN